MIVLSSFCFSVQRSKHPHLLQILMKSQSLSLSLSLTHAKLSVIFQDVKFHQFSLCFNYNFKTAYDHCYLETDILDYLNYLSSYLCVLETGFFAGGKIA